MAQSLSVLGGEHVGLDLLGLDSRARSKGVGSGRESFVGVILSVVSRHGGALGSVIIGTPVDGPDAGAAWPSGRPGTVDTGGSGSVTTVDILTFFG